MTVVMNRQKLVTLLGTLGVIPFLIALVMVMLKPDIGLRMFCLYSLAILSFLAGSWWSSSLMGRGATESQRMAVLLISNVCVLIGLVLIIAFPRWGILGMAAVYTGLMMGERKLNVFSQQPEYYRTMRARVSVVVVLLHTDLGTNVVLLIGLGRYLAN